jgi:hypothetical protein
MWTKVKSDGKGLVNISKYNSRKSRLGDCIYARTIINVEKDTLMKIGFGYSDYITIFFNGLPIFFGNSNYQSRDKSFLGIIGYNDNIFLPLKKGDNELLILVGESMGGWGFCFRKEDEIFIDENLKKLWSLKDSLSLPESVVYDELNEVCYVSNYFNDGNEYISKISTTGEVIEKEWIKGVRMPTGLDIDKNYLYVVTRVGLLIIDISDRIAETSTSSGNNKEINNTKHLIESLLKNHYTSISAVLLMWDEFTISNPIPNVNPVFLVRRSLPIMHPNASSPIPKSSIIFKYGNTVSFKIYWQPSNKGL